MEVSFRELKATLEEKGVALNQDEQYEAFRYRQHALILDSAKQKYSAEELAMIDRKARDEEAEEELRADHEEFESMDDKFVPLLVREHWATDEPDRGAYETDSDFIAGALWSIAKSLNRLNTLIVKGYTHN
jgi:hypothetical protein